MSDEYLSKEEIRKWRSSVEKITLEEYAARLGKKLQEEKKTNDLADMLYTHFNPHQSTGTYDTVTKLEKIDLTPRSTSSKTKHSLKDEFDDFVTENYDIANEEDFTPKSLETKTKHNKETVKKEVATPKATKSASSKDNNPKPEKQTEKKVDNGEKSIKKEPVTDKKTKEEKVITTKQKAAPAQKEKAVEKVAKAEKTNINKKSGNADFSSLNITFKKPLTDREEKVLSYFVEKRGEIVYAKDLADLLELKRDYIYKYIKNLRSKMSTDIINNADNGGFKLD